MDEDYRLAGEKHVLHMQSRQSTLTGRWLACRISIRRVAIDVLPADHIADLV